ncbi:MAG: hypothetical protein ACP5TO_07545, partial [Thermoplasmata archaeon]
SLSDEATRVEKIPAWLKEGGWIRSLTGTDPLTFQNEYSPDYEKIPPITCPFLILHATFDEWLKTDFVHKVYKIAKGKKVLIEVPQKPIFTKSAFVTHPLPVVEQFHWALPLAVDWIMNNITEKYKVDQQI